IGDGTALLRAGNPGITRIVPMKVIRALEHCRGFKTLDHHLRTMIDRGIGMEEGPEAILEVLHGLVEKGLLVPWAEFLARIREPLSISPAFPSSVLLPPGSPPSRWAPLAAPILENAREHGRAVRLLVVGGEGESSLRRDGLSHLNAARVRLGLPIEVAGPEEILAFQRELVRRTGLPPERVAFALGDPSGLGDGAGWNAYLLGTAGECVVTVDPDTRCRIALPRSGMREGFGFSSHDDPIEERYADNREHTLTLVEVVDRDLLALHAGFLGRSLWECTGRATPAPMEDVSEQQLAALAHGDGRISATVPGGIRGIPNGSSLVNSVRRRRAPIRPKDGGAAFHHLRSGGEILRCVSRATVAGISAAEIVGAGLDNRELLPPFFPALQGGQKAFWTVLERCFDRQFIVHLPWMAWPEPWGSEMPQGTATGSPPREFFVERVLTVCMEAFILGPFKRSPGDRMRALGRQLVDLASLASPDFDDVMRRLLWRKDSDSLLELDRRLAESRDGAEGLTRELEQLMEGIRARMMRPDYLVPADLGGSARSSAEACALSQGLVRAYGCLLEDWPDLWSAARELRAAGGSPFKAI
ncbi:MAG TPA: hypothetical protein VEN81_10130, partial [Planctomycetota bacterium]|nr:hypothetical protein [Planctomycetota bacterium]